MSNIIYEDQNGELEKQTYDYSLLDETIRIAVKDEIMKYHDKVSQRTVDAWEDFNRQSQYLQLLLEVQGRTDHKVHEEIDEAIKKLKELTYKQ